MITIVNGTPCSGKTTYVRQHAGYDDLIWDWDAVEFAISGNDYQHKNANLNSLMKRIRQLIVEEFMINKCIENKWLICTELNQQLIKDLQTVDAINIVEMDTDITTCLSRLERTDRPDKDELADVITGWYDKHTEWW